MGVLHSAFAQVVGGLDEDLQAAAKEPMVVKILAMGWLNVHTSSEMRNHKEGKPRIFQWNQRILKYAIIWYNTLYWYQDVSGNTPFGDISAFSWSYFQLHPEEMARETRNKCAHFCCTGQQHTGRLKLNILNESCIDIWIHNVCCELLFKCSTIGTIHSLLWLQNPEINILVLR